MKEVILVATLALLSLGILLILVMIWTWDPVSHFFAERFVCKCEQNKEQDYYPPNEVEVA